MTVYPENTGLSKKVIKQKRERHTPLNPPSMGEEVEHLPSFLQSLSRRGGVPFISHPEPSFGEGLRISSDTTPVILRLRIQKP